MFRAFQTELDVNGNGYVEVGPDNAAMEWDIYQISVSTVQVVDICAVLILHNGFFLCGTPQGSRDTATGPPDTVVKTSDTLIVEWYAGAPYDTATAAIWYNENPVGTTTSSAH